MLTGCIPENIELPRIVEPVDLGLSVKWASCNVGASFPEDYGDYFDWGNPTPNYSGNHYAIDWSMSELRSSGIIGDGGYLTASHDAATVNWGSSWRMPTSDEINELIDKCTWSWTIQNGVKGYKVTGPNGNSIFLPAAGCRFDGLPSQVEFCGEYWSATPLSDSHTVYALKFDSDSYKRGDIYFGMHHVQLAVRPVYGNPPERISVSTGNASDITHNSATLCGVLNNSKQPLTCGIIYGTSASLSITSGTMKSTTSSDEFSVSVNGLSASTTYYYRSYVVVDGVYRYGDVLLFTTKGKTSVTSGGAIDLGLSVKWASCNVGADSHEDYGDYFAWGETLPKSDYFMSNSATYDLSHSELKSRGVIGSDGNLTAAYDAAIVNWGSDWRMPTLAEIKELVNDCTWELITINGVSGNKVTGPNGNFIFLPAAGYRGGTEVRNSGSSGYYWSATHYERYPYGPYRFLFYEGDWKWDYFISYDGLSVRPVTEK